MYSHMEMRENPPPAAPQGVEGEGVGGGCVAVLVVVVVWEGGSAHRWKTVSSKYHILQDYKAK